MVLADGVLITVDKAADEGTRGQKILMGETLTYCPSDFTKPTRSPNNSLT